MIQTILLMLHVCPGYVDPPKDGAAMVGSDPVLLDYTQHPVVDVGEQDRGPRRIVSIAPSITEICAALGLADRLVGRTQFCTHPPSVETVPIVGGYTDTNFEKIVSLKPDVVLITELSPNLIEPLEGLGLRYEKVPADTLDDVFRAIEKVGAVCERPASAKRLAHLLREDLRRIREAHTFESKPRILFVPDALPPEPSSLFVAGPGSYVGDILIAAGCRNAADGFVAQAWSRISAEAILSIKPDCIMEVRDNKDIHSDIYQGWSALTDVPAFRDQHVISLQCEAVLIPGPRVNLAMSEMLTALKKHAATKDTTAD